MKTRYTITFLACAIAISAPLGLARCAPADGAAPLVTTVRVDAGTTLQTMDPQRLGGTNVANWYERDTYYAPEVQKWFPELHAHYIRIPGGSVANIFYWNGNGVRGADGLVDPSRVGPDGFPAVDYSAYAPSFTVDTKTLHPESGWHGFVDVKTMHDFIKGFPGIEAFVCPNAGTGRAVDAAEWVKWANRKMGYDVRYWEIGNELDGSWEPGHDLPFGKGEITAAIYTKRYNDMADAMRKVDPTIKIGSCPFVQETLRDCGTNVDFVSIHTYPGSATLSDDAMFADIGKTVSSQVAPIRKWIHQYQPNREGQIEICYSEWNLAGGLDNSKMFSGLWASIFLGELARNGVSIATEFDCFSDLLAGSQDHYARKSEYDALWLWNNYMGKRLIPATSSNPSVYTYATRSDDAVVVMLINTDHEREARANVQLAGFAPAATGEVATVTSREYNYNSITKHVQWSTGPRIEKLKTGADFGVTLAPFSMTYVRIPNKAKPALSQMAIKAIAAVRAPRGAPELRFVAPSETYAGDTIQGEVLALAAGSELPYQGALAPAALTANGEAAFDRQQARLAEDVGHFSMRPTVPGELTITARSGDATATQTILVKPSVPRPIVYWDFSTPPVTDKDMFSSSYSLNEDLTQRPNRAVARVDLPGPGANPDAPDKDKFILGVNRMPESDKLNKANIRGVIVDVKTSKDLVSDDPGACILVAMQSPANWWMQIGTIPLKGDSDWTTHELDITNDDYFKALPSAEHLLFVLRTSKPVKGSIYLDHIGFMVR